MGVCVCVCVLYMHVNTMTVDTTIRALRDESKRECECGSAQSLPTVTPFWVTDLLFTDMSI